MEPIRAIHTVIDGVTQFSGLYPDINNRANERRVDPVTPNTASESPIQESARRRRGYSFSYDYDYDTIYTPKPRNAYRTGGGVI